MIDTRCVESCASLSYWSIVMTSLVEFSTGEFQLRLLESRDKNKKQYLL